VSGCGHVYGGRDVRSQPVVLTLRPALWHNSLTDSAVPDVVTGHVMKNGLYSIHVSLQDGRTGKGSGVVMFREGKIVGGDAYLYYTGSYTTKGDTFKGEVLVQRHTSSPDANPLFGGPSPVGVGVSGTFTDTRAVMNGTALVGKASQIFTATLRKLAEIE
jgi:T3SS negative regulator,GrlR